MKAMILAAGLGTRLRPITDNMPKALVPVEGVPMLERIIFSLKNQGFSQIIVNVHHFSRMIKDFLDSRDFGIEIFISDETEELLDTGGALVKASGLLFNNPEPVLVHNVDILCDADLRGLMRSHLQSEASVSLLVSPRDSSRKLIFAPDMKLIGWHDLSADRFRPENICISDKDKEFAFSGIYVVGPRAVLEMKALMGEGKFPVMDYFLNPLRSEIIKGVIGENVNLIDIGKPATLSRASDVLKNLNNCY